MKDASCGRLVLCNKVEGDGPLLGVVVILEDSRYVLVTRTAAGFDQVDALHGGKRGTVHMLNACVRLTGIRKVDEHAFEASGVASIIPPPEYPQP